MAEARTTNASARPVPTTANEIETWAEVRGRVYSVQVGAFRVSPMRSLVRFGYSDPRGCGGRWLAAPVFGRFDTEAEAGRICRHFRTMVDRMPLLWSTSMADAFPCWKRARRRPGTGRDFSRGKRGNRGGGASGIHEPVETTSEARSRFQVQLGAYSSTIPVRWPMHFGRATRVGSAVGPRRWIDPM